MESFRRNSPVPLSFTDSPRRFSKAGLRRARHRVGGVFYDGSLQDAERVTAPPSDLLLPVISGGGLLSPSRLPREMTQAVRPSDPATKKKKQPSPQLSLQRRFVIKKTLVALAFALLGTIIFWMQYGIGGFLHWPAPEEAPLHYGELLVLRCHYLFVFAEAVRWELWRRRFRCTVKEGRLLITKGGLRPTESSTSLQPATEFYLSQDKRDLILGLYSLTICTPLHHTAGLQKFSTLEGLSKKEAIALRELLVKTIAASQTSQRGPVKRRPNHSQIWHSRPTSRT